jgi:hypothetical protein
MQKNINNKKIQIKMKITKQTNLGEIMELKGVNEVLSKHDVPCISCPMAQFEMNELTLGQICENYDIDAEKLIQELSKLKK